MQYHLPASLTSQVVQKTYLANPRRTTESHYVRFSFHWQIKWSKLMWPQWPEEWSTKRNWAILPTKLDTSQLFSVMDSLQSPVSRISTNLVYVTTSSNKEPKRISINTKTGWRHRALGNIALDCTSLMGGTRPILEAANPPIPFVIGRSSAPL